LLLKCTAFFNIPFEKKFNIASQFIPFQIKYESCKNLELNLREILRFSNSSFY